MVTGLNSQSPSPSGIIFPLVNAPFLRYNWGISLPVLMSPYLLYLPYSSRPSIYSNHWLTKPSHIFSPSWPHLKFKDYVHDPFTIMTIHFNHVLRFCFLFVFWGISNISKSHTEIGLTSGLEFVLRIGETRSKETLLVHPNKPPNLLYYKCFVSV